MAVNHTTAQVAAKSLCPRLTSGARNHLPLKTRQVLLLTAAFKLVTQLIKKGRLIALLFYPNPENRADSAIPNIASYLGKAQEFLCNSNNCCHSAARARTEHYWTNSILHTLLSPGENYVPLSKDGETEVEVKQCARGGREHCGRGAQASRVSAA